MFQVNILNSNYYPIRQVMVTTNELSAIATRNRLRREGKLAGVIDYS